MTQILVDRSHLASDDIQKLVNNTQISHLAIGSKSRLVFDVLNDKLNTQADALEAALDQGLFSKATGTNLELFGELFNVPKPPACRAEVLADEENFYFYTLESDFGTINGGNDIVLLKGTQIFNTPTVEKATVAYIVKEDVTLPSDERGPIYVGAVSASVGATANVGAGSLNYHNFTNYADILNNTLLVTNQTSVVYGRDEMSDDNYRYLIRQQILLNESANYDAIETKIIIIPGIAGVKRILYRRGIGTADWIVKSVTPTVGSDLLAKVQTVLNTMRSDGLDHRALSPVTVGVQLFLSIKWKRNLDTNARTKEKNTIIQNLTNYINNLDLGQELNLDQLIKVTLEASTKIENLGTYNKPLDGVFIFKTSSISNSRVKQTLVDNYITNDWERVLAEPTVTSINITDLN